MFCGSDENNEENKKETEESNTQTFATFSHLN